MFVWILVGFLGLIAVLWLLFLAASASVEIMKDIVESARSVMVYCRSLFRRISIDKTKSLRERNQHRIQVALSGQLSSELDVPKVVNQTLENIMHAEGRLDLLKTHAEWPREWSPEFEGLLEWIELRHELWLGLTKRLQDQVVARRLNAQKRQRQDDSEKELFWNTNQGFFKMFLGSAERACVSIDAYGDKVIDEDALKKQTEICLVKIKSRIGQSIPKSSIPSVFLFEQGSDSKLDLNDWEMESFLQERFKAYITTSGAGTEDLREIDQMSGIQFEVWVADSLKAHGHQNVRGTPATGDQGADLITELDGKKIIIQSKRYKANVGNAAVQEVSSAVAFYKADEGWVITSSYFTESAVQLARSCSVKLIDRNQLLEPERWGKLG
jgi:hypothetical protein